MLSRDAGKEFGQAGSVSDLPTIELSDEDRRSALRDDSLRLARYWVPCIAVLLLVEAVYHLNPVHLGRVTLSLLSCVATGALSWAIWKTPERLSSFAWWILIPWALSVANIWSHIYLTPILAVVFATMVVLSSAALLTPTLSIAIAFPVTVLLQIHTVTNVYGEMANALLIPVFSIPLAVLINFGRRQSALDAARTRRLEQAFQRQAVQLNRIDGLTSMSRNVAHHFNNLLTGVVAGSSTALETLDQNHPAHKWVSFALESAATASAITSRLISYSGNRSLSKTRISIEQLINEDTLRQHVPESIAFRSTIDDQSATILGSLEVLNEALQAIISNAVEAIGDDGTISVDACRDESTGGAMIQITDNGEGIADQNLPMAFEPFFTTREPTRLGLGLAYVVGVMRQHGGDVTTASTLGQGTTITLRFPVEA